MQMGIPKQMRMGVLGGGGGWDSIPLSSGLTVVEYKGFAEAHMSIFHKQVRFLLVHPIELGFQAEVGVTQAVVHAWAWGEGTLTPLCFGIVLVRYTYSTA
jgi:hypothetical protein